MQQTLEGLQHGRVWAVTRRIVDILLILCGVASVATIFSTVVARYIFKTDIYGMEEIILTIAFWLYFSGSIAGSMEDSHIKADLLDVYVQNHKVKYSLKTLAKAIEVVVYVVFSKLSIDLVVTNLQKMPRTTGLKIPLAVAQFPIAVGFVLMALFALYYGLLYLSCVKAGKDAEGGK